MSTAVPIMCVNPDILVFVPGLKNCLGCLLQCMLQRFQPVELCFNRNRLQVTWVQGSGYNVRLLAASCPQILQDMSELLSQMLQ